MLGQHLVALIATVSPLIASTISTVIAITTLIAISKLLGRSLLAGIVSVSLAVLLVVQFLSALLSLVVSTQFVVFIHAWRLNQSGAFS